MVIGVISVLIGLLLPVLGKARNSARDTACLSNLRQLAVAAANYVADNRGYYPPAQLGALGSWDFRREGVRVRPGLLWGNKTDVRVQQCPAWDGRAGSAGTPFSGYNYNTSFIGRGDGEGPPAKASQVRRPAETALFGDGEYAHGANKFMRSPDFSPTENPLSFGSLKLAGTQSYRHGSAVRPATLVAFADGSATRWTVRYVPPGGMASGLMTPQTGYLSADNTIYDLK